jgi:rod shape-determining protein MreC
MTRTRNTVLLLVVASLALILWDLRASNTTVRVAAQDIAAPLQRTATSVFAPFGAWARDVQQFSDPAVRAQAVAPMAVNAPEGWATAIGRVVAADIAGDRASVTIDAGSDAGIQVGNAVLATGGLVGQVARVSADSALVLLVTDPSSAIGIRVLPSKEMGVAAGSGMGQDLEVAVLNPAAEIELADQVVSLGSPERNGIPADLPVGVVQALDTSPAASGRNAGVRPVTGMTSLETLLVLTEQS